MKKVKFNIGNIPAVLYGEESEKLYLFVHGSRSAKEEAENLAAAAVPLGFRVLSFDLPGHGERKNKAPDFTARNSVSDLKTVIDSIINVYESISLYACSIGAYFSLLACRDVRFRKVLFVSPILDMERLIRNMMVWANVSEEELRTRGEIETDFGETLSWDYYSYVLDNPVDSWNSETFILYGETDQLTEFSVLQSFKRRFNCSVRIMEQGEHYFHTKQQMSFLNSWLNEVV